MNRICQMLGIRYPIIQGAMTNVSDAELVSAVSEGGGLGVYAPGIENVDFDVVRQEIRRIREKTTKPFAVNIMLASQYAAGLVEVVCQERVPVVTTGAGNPSKYMEAFHAAGIKVAPVVPSVEAAVKMEAAGVDFVIAEGMESGGYIGRGSTLVLIPQVVDAVNIPVAAAGGIMDGRTMAAVMMLGAEGVQMGTRFLTAAECTIPDYLYGESALSGELRNRLGNVLIGIERLQLEMGLQFCDGRHLTEIQAEGTAPDDREVGGAIDAVHIVGHRTLVIRAYEHIGAAVVPVDKAGAQQCDDIGPCIHDLIEQISALGIGVREGGRGSEHHGSGGQVQPGIGGDLIHAGTGHDATLRISGARLVHKSIAGIAIGDGFGHDKGQCIQIALAEFFKCVIHSSHPFPFFERAQVCIHFILKQSSCQLFLRLREQ